jgi:hypothetical protein
MCSAFQKMNCDHLKIRHKSKLWKWRTCDSNFYECTLYIKLKVQAPWFKSNHAIILFL